MAEIGSLEANRVATVLTQGMEFANELKKQLNPATASMQMCDSLLEKVLSSYDNALKLLGCVTLIGNGDISTVASGGSDLPVSEEDLDFAEKNVSKKRKTLAKWKDQIKVGSGAGLENQLDDGYNWRKYGQKNILGSHNPRAYYRCTHRNTQGCLATKQVQRADDDPSIYEISYRGRHSCIQERIKQDKENARKEQIRKPQKQKTIPNLPEPKPEMNQEPTANLVPFSFPVDTEMKFFPEPGSFYSPPFLSPATSDSYFSLSQCNVPDLGMGSDLGEIMSNLNPNEDIHFGELDFGDLEFDPRVFFNAIDGALEY